MELTQIDNEDQYFKFSIWCPFIKAVIYHLPMRLSKQSRSTLGLFNLINSEVIDNNIERGL